jgi:hypothetical protein
MPAPKKNVEFVFDISLVDAANRPQFKANPTLAIGDVKISTDEGAFANITTLPTVSPAAGRNVKVSLSASEMNGDRIVVQFVDAAGGEWDEVSVVVLTTAVTVDDLVRSTTPANTLAVDAANKVVGVVTVDTVTTLTGHTPQTGDNFARLGAPAGASVSADVAAVKVDSAAIKAKTDNLPASPAAVGSAMTLTSAYDFAKGTVAMTELYAANGAAPTPVQALYAIQQYLMDFAIAGVSYTVNKLDGTAAFVVTLDSAVAPTAATRT